MLGLKLYLVDMLTYAVYPALSLVAVLLFVLRPIRFDLFFVCFCSIPVSAFCYFIWVYMNGFDSWNLMVFLVEMLVFAQLGWLGGVVFLVGFLKGLRILKS